MLAVALDVGVETVARHASLFEGGDGGAGAAAAGGSGSRYHSLFRWYERFEEQRFQLCMHAAEFAYDRDCRKRCRDPLEELALERRASLKYMGVYEDEIDYERKRRR